MTTPNLSGLKIINGRLVAPDGTVVGRVVNAPVKEAKLSEEKEPCRCKAFCIEDVRKTGRYCRVTRKMFRREQARLLGKGKPPVLSTRTEE